MEKRPTAEIKPPTKSPTGSKSSSASIKSFLNSTNSALSQINLNPLSAASKHHNKALVIAKTLNACRPLLKFKDDRVSLLAAQQLIHTRLAQISASHRSKFREERAALYCALADNNEIARVEVSLRAKFGDPWDFVRNLPVRVESSRSVSVESEFSIRQDSIPSTIQSVNNTDTEAWISDASGSSMKLTENDNIEGKYDGHHHGNGVSKKVISSHPRKLQDRSAQHITINPTQSIHNDINSSNDSRSSVSTRYEHFDVMRGKRKRLDSKTSSLQKDHRDRKVMHMHHEQSSSDISDVRNVERDLNTVDLFTTQFSPTTIWLGLDLDLVIKAGESVNLEFDPSVMMLNHDPAIELDDISYDLGVTIMGLSQISVTVTRINLDRHRHILHIWNSSAHTISINCSRIFVYLNIVQHFSHIPRKTISST